MAKTTGPLLSLRARGQIAKTLVYADWRGIPYARTYVIPQNPRTSGQLQTRQAFEYLNAAYAVMAPILSQVYGALTRGRPLTDRNRWVQANLRSIRSASDTTDLVVSPGQSPIPTPQTVVFTPAAGQVTIAAADPVLPDGWQFPILIGIAFSDGDPSNTGPYTMFGGFDTDNATPFSTVVTGLPAGDYHVAALWLMQTSAAPILTRYSRSVDDIVTVL